MAVYLGNITVSSGASAGAGALVQVAALPATGENDKLYLLIADFGGYTAGLYYFTDHWTPVGTGSGDGTTDYRDLDNKPRINGTELTGNKTNVQLNIADRDNTYTKIEVDNIVAAAQKIYVSQTMPDPLTDRVGLYYYDVQGDGSTYQLYIIDSNKTITDLGSASISLSGYQTVTDVSLETDDKTVPGAINELKRDIEALDVNDLEFNGLRGIQVVPEYGDDGVTVESYTIQHRNTGMTNSEVDEGLQQLNFGDVFDNDTFSHDAQGHKTEQVIQQYQLPTLQAGDNIEIDDDGAGVYTINSLSKGIVEVNSLPSSPEQDVLYKYDNGVYWYNGTEFINITEPQSKFIEDVLQLPTSNIDENMLYRVRENNAFNDRGLYTYIEDTWYSLIGGGGDGGDLPAWEEQLLIDIFSNNTGVFANTLLRDSTVGAGSTWSSAQISGYLNNNYYTKGQVDSNIASALKVYVQPTVPTSSSDAGLYYVGTTNPYDTYVVDSLGAVKKIGTTNVDLTDYQKKEDTSLNTVSKEIVGAINELIGNQLMPVGMIAPFGGSVAPEGWLLCDGSEYDIFIGGQPTAYYKLYEVIGQSYGGSGTKFKVPDFAGKFLEGASTTTGHRLGNSVSSALPAPSLKFTGSQVSTGTMLETNGNTSTKSTGSFRTTTARSAVSLTASGAFSVGSSSQNAASGSDATSNIVNMNVQHIHKVTAAGTVGLDTSEKIYGKSTVVQPESICVNYIIKY